MTVIAKKGENVETVNCNKKNNKYVCVCYVDGQMTCAEVCFSSVFTGFLCVQCKTSGTTTKENEITFMQNSWGPIKLQPGISQQNELNETHYVSVLSGEIKGTKKETELAGMLQVLISNAMFSIE